MRFKKIFDVAKEDLDAHGAIDISLINDLPLFIDPFLLFGSDKEEYAQLHNDIITYITFLRDRANAGTMDLAIAGRHATQRRFAVLAYHDGLALHEEKSAEQTNSNER